MKIKGPPASLSESAVSSSAHQDGLPRLHRRLAIWAVSFAVVLSVLSLTSVGVALPVIARDLGLVEADAVWLVSAFQLALLGTLFPFSAIGERWGYRSTFLAGLALITFSSIVCTFARSFEILLLGRVLQGIGASAAMAVNPALLRLSVPANRLGHVIGLNAMVVAVATALGPSLAAVVLSVASWPWLFALNVPWAVLAMAVGAAVLPRARGAAATAPFDVTGAVLNVVTFVLLASALDALAARGVAALPHLVAGVLCAVALVLQQRRRVVPLLPLDLMRAGAVRACVGSSVFAFAAQMTALVALPFLLHDGLGMDMLTVGLLMMGWPLAVAFMAPAAAHLESRGLSSSVLCSVGAGVMCAALLALAALPRQADESVWFGLLVLCGLGFGLFQTPNNRAMLGATPRERSGSAGGLQATARLTGQMLGATAVGVCFRLLPGQPEMAGAWGLMAAAAFGAASAVFSFQRRQ